MRAQVPRGSGLFSHLSLVPDWSQATAEVLGSWTSRCDVFMEVAFGHMGGSLALWHCLCFHHPLVAHGATNEKEQQALLACLNIAWHSSLDQDCVEAGN